MEKTTILKVLVGSRAHGLHTEESDYDYRGVFILPTEELLGLNPKTKNVDWQEGKEDNTFWEIGHFLRMATRCNPTILETFLAPPQDLKDPHSQGLGAKLQDLFPYVWNANDVRNAFIGYGLNQRKKFLEKKDDRPNKYAVAYLRTLIQAHSLLTQGTFNVDMRNGAEYETLKRWKAGNFEVGEVIQKCLEWQKQVDLVADKCEKETDYDKVEKFLLSIRKQYFTYK